MNNYEPFQIVEALRKLEDSRYVSYYCPHCGVSGMISKNQIKAVYNVLDDCNVEILATVVCSNPGCKKLSAYVEKYKSDIRIGDLKKIGDFITMARSYNIIERTVVYPDINAIPLMFEHNETKQYVPELILKDFNETQRLMAISPNAAIVFARRTLERIILEKWPEVVEAPHKPGELPNLASMLNWMEENNAYSDVTTLKALKNIANYATHIMDPKQEISFSYQDAQMALYALDRLIIDEFINPNSYAEYKLKMRELEGEKKGMKKEQVQATLNRGQSFLS